MATTYLYLSILHELLDYNPTTGVFTWRVRRHRVKPGDVAGVLDGRGYQSIQVCGKSYRAHRLAWFYVYGTWPDGQIDHRNGCRSDNRLSNLRVCTNAENGQNRGLNKNNTSGYIGVSFDRRNVGWQAHIRVNGKRHNLGLFKDKEEAAAAYVAAKAKLHPYQPTPRIVQAGFLGTIQLPMALATSRPVAR